MQPDKAGTAPAFPADHLAGAKADRVLDTKDGLTAWAALQVLGPVPERSDSSSKLSKFKPEVRPAPRTWVDAMHDYNLLWTLRVSRFTDLLRKGSWHAKGFRAPVEPTARRERIPPEKWEILSIDLDDNSASGGGIEYVGLRFFEAKPGAKKTKKAENQCCEWLVEVMKAKRRKVLSQLKEEAGQKIPGLSDKAFKRAWKFAKDQPTTHESWQPRGPIPSL